MKSEQIGELAKALSAAQCELHGALKDSTNPFFKSKYADLESVWAACRGALAKNGLSVVQTVGSDQHFGPMLVTTLLHSSGQWIEGSQPVMAKNQTPQEFGSALTYARRYGLAAIVGVVQVDDDAEGAKKKVPTEDGHGSKDGGKVASPATQAFTAKDPAEFVITFGKKFKGLRLADCDIYELNSFAAWLKETDQSAKPLSDQARETLQAINAFLATREKPRQ